MNAHDIKESVLKTWLVILLLVAAVLAQSLLSLLVVGDMGPPAWDYRLIKDVPGESAYAIYRKVPYPQHIRGSKGE